MVFSHVLATGRSLIAIGLSLLTLTSCGQENVTSSDSLTADQDPDALLALTGGISITVDSTQPTGNNFSGQLPAGFTSTSATGSTVIAWNRSTSGQWCAWSHGCVPTAAQGPIACTNGNPTCSVSSGVLNCKINDNPYTDNSNISGQPCVVSFFPPSTPTCSISITSGLVGGRIPRAGGSLQFQVTASSGASVIQNPNGSVSANPNSSPIQRTFQASVRNSSTGQTGSCSITVQQEGLTPPTCSLSVTSGVVNGVIPQGGATLSFRVTPSSGASITRDPSGSLVTANNATSTIQRMFQAHVSNSSTGQTGSCTINVPQAGLTPPPTCSLSVISGAPNGVIPQGGGTLNFRVTPSSGASIVRDPSGSIVTANNSTSTVQRIFQAHVSNSATGQTGSCTINVPQAGQPIDKTTSFFADLRAFIEGHKLDCIQFSTTIGSRFVWDLLVRPRALTFCAITAASFRESENTNLPRMKLNFGMRAVCTSTDAGRTWRIKSSNIHNPPGCFMGAETLGPPEWDLVIGNGQVGNCIANANGSNFNGFVDGSPPQHLDALGLQAVKNRVCTSISVGINGTFGCRSDGVATLSAQGTGTNFPSLAWKIDRINPSGIRDSATKVMPQVQMENLWDCPNGNMASGNKGLIELK